jgi:hypothetical protein
VAKVFISYVKEDSVLVNKLVDALNVHGIDTWIDKTNLTPGTRWKTSIRKAIEGGDFFIACFSENYNNRAKTYMNEELTFAIEELRMRPTNRIWFIPVKISECEIPDKEIGAGETLNSFHYVELFKDWNGSIRKIVRAINPDYIFDDSGTDYPKLLKQFPAIPVNIALDVIFEIMVSPSDNKEIIAVKGAGGIGKTFFAHELMRKVSKLGLPAIKYALIDHYHLQHRHHLGLCKAVQNEIDPTSEYFKDFSKNFRKLEMARAAGDYASIDRLQSQCVKLFFEELQTMTESNKVVFFFDTFEVMRKKDGEFTHLTDWFDSLFQVNNIKSFFLYRPHENRDEIDTFLQKSANDFSMNFIEYQIQTLSWSSALTILSNREVILSNDELTRLFKISSNHPLIFIMAVEYMKTHGKESILKLDDTNINRDELIQNMINEFIPPSKRDDIPLPPQV